MRELPHLMNVLNLESRNVMDTRLMEHANGYNARTNGLIKSASTSTCCANENALFEKACRKFLQYNKNAAANTHYEMNSDHHHPEYLSVSLVPSVSLSQAAAATVARASRGFVDENTPKKKLQVKLRLSHLKHFSDCSLNNVGLPNHPKPPTALTNGTLSQADKKTPEEFSSHRSLDNILIDRSPSGRGSGAIMNFTAANDIKQEDLCNRVNGMSLTVANNQPADAAPAPIKNCNNGVADGQNEVSPQTDNSDVHISAITERRRKNIIFKANAPTLFHSKEPTPSPPSEMDEKRFRRSSSLKMPKDFDSNPAQKKIVRFADALGLDLTNVRTFLDELPSIPKSAYIDLQNEEPTDKHLQPQAPTDTKTLIPMFKQPHTSLNFLDRIRDNNVSLEFVKVCPTPICSISGTVRVRNLDFFKSVYIRYSADNWRTFKELQAIYVPDSCDGFSDKFAFVIYVYDMKVNQRIELAVRFHCNGSIYWDNNNGSNYVFQCLPSAPVPSYFQVYNNPAIDSCNSSFY